MMLDDERLSTLIDRILGAARIEKNAPQVPFETVSMRRFVEGCLRKTATCEKEGRTIARKGDAHAVDRTAMRVVLSNSWKMPRATAQRFKIRLRIQKDLRNCRLDVIDSGFWESGKNPRMFLRCSGEDQMNETACARDGGLYIVRNIVKDHRGKVWASSQRRAPRGVSACACPCPQILEPAAPGAFYSAGRRAENNLNREQKHDPDSPGGRRMNLTVRFI